MGLLRACAMTPGVILILLSLGMMMISSAAAAADDCNLWEGIDSKADCSTNPGKEFQGTKTLWWDSFSGKIFRAMCCKPGSEEEKSKLEGSSPGCRTTNCVPISASTSICHDREFANGTALEYEEAIRDNCIDSDGKPGVVAQCCLKNSTEGMLLSIMGAELGEFPHQVGIMFCTDAGCAGCGGTIYNRNHVLTAAHCVTNQTTGQLFPASAFTIQVGTTIGGHSDFDSKGVKVQVADVIHHRNFSRLDGNPECPDGVVYNDIALLKINGSFNFSDRVKSLELAPEGFVPETYAPNAVILGWGTTDNLELSSHLQKANARILSDDDCFGSSLDETSSERAPWGWGSYKDSHEQYLCAGGIYNHEWSASTGEGDSGGPAICRGPTGNPVLCGITSFGNDQTACAPSGDAQGCLPSVFAEVEYFRRNWDLLKKAGPQEPENFFRYKLYGDENVPADKYLHQVHITSGTGMPCGGTLIAKNLVLTAASCVAQVDENGKPTENRPDLQVFHGVRDLADDSRPPKELQLQDVLFHPEFTRVGPEVTPESQYDQKQEFYRIKMADNYHQHDVALIKLAGNAPVDDSRLAKLPEAGSTPVGPATELALPRDLTYGGKMRSREFKFVPKDNCQKRLSRLSNMGVNTTLDDDILCAVERYSGGSTCDRELGGGLICKGTGGEDVICGVQVFRLCEYSIPNGFIDVANSLDFIDDAKASFGVQ